MLWNEHEASSLPCSVAKRLCCVWPVKCPSLDAALVCHDQRQCQSMQLKPLTCANTMPCTDDCAVTEP